MLQYSDAKLFKSLVKVHDKTVIQMMDYQRIRTDLLKMLPFSLFISVPFMEIFLPPYLILFPNAMPSTFLTREQVKEREKVLSSKEKSSYKNLSKLINKFLIEGGLDIRKLD